MIRKLVYGMKKIVLIDGNSLMFRAYYATAYTGNLMQTSSGMYTNALYGFVNMINKIKDTEGMTNIFVAFDKGKKTFRHQEYSDYKGTRKPMPEEFAMQIPLIKEYLDICKITRLETDDYEADDLIASVATLAKKDCDQILVLTGDKDLLQLVDDQVTVALTKKGITELEYYTPENFKELMGFTAKQLIDYKGLIGDASDNLPGVSGVGPKTAVKLLEQYGTLEKIVEDGDNIKGKLGEMIRQDHDVALRTKRLATLYRNAPLELTIDDMKCEKPAVDSLRRFYEKVEFKSFIKRLETIPTNDNQETSPITEEIAPITMEPYVNQLALFKTYLTNIKSDEEIGIEVEITESNYHKANLIGLAILIKNEGFYFDNTYIYDDIIKNFLESQNYRFISIDVKKVCCTLMKYGINMTNFKFDATLASYILNPSLPNQDIKYICEEYIATKLPYFEDVYGKKNQWVVPDVEEVAKYALEKCYYLMKVRPLMDKVLQEREQTSLLYDMELPLAKVLAKVELNGFKVNIRRLQEIGEFLMTEMKSLEQKIYQEAGHEFNIGSPKQLGVVLFDELGLGKGKKNKTGYSTSAEILESLATEHAIAQLVLDYRKYSKLQSTYVTGLIEEVSAIDGKVHTTFKQSLTATGRLSSTEPNIQNIPIQTEDGRLIRSAFVPSFPDGYIVSADYSQIELRILAHVSNCQNMIDDFNNGKDFHTTTAAKIYDEPENMVTKEMRRVAKAVNFGIVYGMSDWGLSEQLHISPFSASNFIKRYFAIYPEIRTYLDDTITTAKEKGYSETIYKRRRYMPEINSSNHALRKFAERTAMNAPIQGAAADIIKYAMIIVQKTLDENKLTSKLVAQVHDELILDVPPYELEIIKDLLKEAMEHAVQLKVKMTVDVEWGQNWDLK